MGVSSDPITWPILVWREEDSYAQILKDAKQFGIAVVRTVGEALALPEARHA